MSNSLIPAQTPYLLCSACLAAATSHAAEDTQYEYKFESYREDHGLRVFSQYYDLKHLFSTGTTVDFRYVIDALSGATPPGTYAEYGGAPDIAQMKDERRSVGLSTSQKIDNHEVNFEFVQSHESDYLSNSYALSDKAEFNDKNTTVSGGVSFTDDLVESRPFITTNSTDRRKENIDLALGVSQILDKNTVVDLNATYGRAHGYLNDQYKYITQFDPYTVGGVQYMNVTDFPENRPPQRDRFALKIAARHYLENPGAGLEGSYRFFCDGDGVISHTFEFTWSQQIGDRLIVSPFFRYYIQSAANYYYPYLPTGFPTSDPATGQAPYYSSDYRLAALQSFGFGASVDLRITDSLKLTAKYQRYEMFGMSANTPGVLFPSANIVTVGMNGSF
jgi:hypothetical protein